MYCLSSKRLSKLCACNLYWERHHLSANCIAVEHTLREECDSGLPTRREDRVTHAGNCREHTIVTPTSVCYVDGFDPVT